MKKFFLAYAWILLSTGVILTSIAAFNFIILKDYQLIAEAEPSSAATPSPSLVATAQTGQVQGIKTDYQLLDARATLVSNFLERYKSPLTPYDYFGEFFVELADQYQFDFRLLPAIAMQESNLCKVTPPDSYNCLGFGVHSQGTLTFESYEANFTRAARELKANYIEIGLTTPEEIMTKYTPSSDGSWAESVNQWMAEMKYDDRAKGKSLKTNSSVLEYAEASQAGDDIVR